MQLFVASTLLCALQHVSQQCLCVPVVCDVGRADLHSVAHSKRFFPWASGRHPSRHAACDSPSALAHAALWSHTFLRHRTLCPRCRSCCGKPQTWSKEESRSCRPVFLKEPLRVYGSQQQCQTYQCIHYAPCMILLMLGNSGTGQHPQITVSAVVCMLVHEYLLCTPLCHAQQIMYMPGAQNQRIVNLACVTFAGPDMIVRHKLLSQSCAYDVQSLYCMPSILFSCSPLLCPKYGNLNHDPHSYAGIKFEGKMGFRCPLSSKQPPLGNAHGSVCHCQLLMQLLMHALQVPDTTLLSLAFC